ncbi:hypothetical protein FHG87_015702 [Trinorchestia longiramus]|nr:hypothetical protein FHG87_015702 [Trinorchestia longiramus]
MQEQQRLPWITSERDPLVYPPSHHSAWFAQRPADTALRSLGNEFFKKGPANNLCISTNDASVNMFNINLCARHP